MAGTYCGGTLTEILNDELDTNEGGFSRRRVVKGVAWTLPVLVTAVGAPPASASPGPVVAASFAWGTASQGSASGPAGTKSVQGPMEFTIETGSAFTGTSVTYIVTIQGNQTNQNAKLQVASS